MAEKSPELELALVAKQYQALQRSRNNFISDGWTAAVARHTHEQLRPSDMFYEAICTSPGNKLGNSAVKLLLEKVWLEPAYPAAVNALKEAIASKAQSWMKGGYSITPDIANNVLEELNAQGWLLIRHRASDTEPAKL